MADNGIRVGFISSYNAAAGTASIYYPDRTGNITAELPVFSPCGLLQKLEKDEEVWVLHLPNGSAAGLVMGKCSAEGDTPKASIYTENDSLTLKDPSGIFTLAQLLALKAQVDSLQDWVERLQAQVDALE